MKNLHKMLVSEAGYASSSQASRLPRSPSTPRRLEFLFMPRRNPPPFPTLRDPTRPSGRFIRPGRNKATNERQKRRKRQNGAGSRSGAGRGCFFNFGGRDSSSSNGERRKRWQQHRGQVLRGAVREAAVAGFERGLEPGSFPEPGVQGHQGRQGAGEGRGVRQEAAAGNATGGGGGSIDALYCCAKGMFRTCFIFREAGVDVLFFIFGFILPRRGLTASVRWEG